MPGLSGRTHNRVHRRGTASNDQVTMPTRASGTPSADAMQNGDSVGGKIAPQYSAC